MRTYDFAPLWRSTVGFDRLLNLLDDSARWTGEDNYPPYNIERTGPRGDEAAPDHDRCRQRQPARAQEGGLKELLQVSAAAARPASRCGPLARKHKTLAIRDPSRGTAARHSIAEKNRIRFLPGTGK